jgi:hypothetical protein
MCSYLFVLHAEAREIRDTTGVEYSVATWPGFKRSAVSITFDDNYRFQITKAMPLLNEHHFKATYFIVTNRVGKGWAPGWDTLNMVALQGHEIGSHSVNHPNFAILSLNPLFADSMRREFTDSRNTINAHIPSQQCETFAWPFGAVNPPAIVQAKQYYMACRGSSNGYESTTPENYFNIYSQHIYHATPLEEVNTFIDNILRAKGWLVERWHGFKAGQDTNGYEPVPIGVFKSHLDYIALNNDSLWVAPLNKVVKYMQERENTVLHFFRNSPSEMTLSLTNWLPDTLFHYNVPLSLRIRFNDPGDRLGFILQDNNPLPFTVRNFSGTNYYCFDAVPNRGLIHLRLAPDAVFNAGSGNEGYTGNYPNPFGLSTNVVFFLSEPEFVTVRVFNSWGIPLQDYSNRFLAGKNRVVIDGSSLQPGEYFCLVETAEKKSVFRLVRCF